MEEVHFEVDFSITWHWDLRQVRVTNWTQGSNLVPTKPSPVTTTVSDMCARLTFLLTGYNVDSSRNVRIKPASAQYGTDPKC